MPEAAVGSFKPEKEASGASNIVQSFFTVCDRRNSVKGSGISWISECFDDCTLLVARSVVGAQEAHCT